MRASGGPGTDSRSTWALPVGLVLLVAGAVLAVLVHSSGATVLTGILVAVAVAGLVLTAAGVNERRR